MLWIFKALSDRIKALFVTDVAADLEAQFLAREAERKAALLRQAQVYFTSLRSHFRVDVAELSSNRPIFVTPGTWQIGPPRVERTPRHTSQPAHSKTFVPRSYTPLLPHAGTITIFEAWLAWSDGFAAATRNGTPWLSDSS